MSVMAFLPLMLLLMLRAGCAAGSPHSPWKEDVPGGVLAFLHTGDPATLQRVNCSSRFELSRGAGAHTAAHAALRGTQDALLHAANFLTLLLQTNRSQEREHSPRGDLEWYHALLTSVLEGDPRVLRAALSFTSSPGTPGVYLQARRTERGLVLEEGERVGGTRRRGDREHAVRWSSPYLECDNGNLVPRWLLTLSAGFYGLRSSQVPEFRGIVRVDVSLQDVDIDQCSSSGWFAGTHRCNLTSMECTPVRGHGFVLDKYHCPCRKGFYHPNRVAVNGFKGKGGGRGDGSRGDEQGSSSCLPCGEGCVYCKDDTPCYAQEDGYLRIAAAAFQALCMLGDLVGMVVVYHFRRNKSIRASGLVLLEAILFGALLLYFPVFIVYFQPSTFRCILLRWARVLGFAVVYGTVTLKLYRVLKMFLSRTAQRIPYMTSWRVLHLLAIILLVVFWFLVAWTFAVCQNLERNVPLIDVGFTPEGLQFNTCLLDRWDYMMAVAESLLLAWAVYLCYAVRTVPSAFHEPRYMAVAIHNELILSVVFHTIRFSLVSELHPDWMLMLCFAHTHLTVTITLALMLVPKFLVAGTHTRDDIATEAYEDELDMGRSGSYLNSSITSAWSEHSLDPEDIREELKKLYTQLEIYKRKKMLANNPHLQKKRSSKKGLGRSLMRRITEIPETVSRQCSREDKELGDHGSNRNSICTLRRNPFDPSHSSKSKEESLRNKVFSLKKSHSSYDHVRDHSEDSSSVSDKIDTSTMETSLLDTLMGKKLVKKKSSEKIVAESTESVPLVCKSASAHNLTADKKPIHPRTSMLQKSLSVIASAKEKTLGLTGKSQNTEDVCKKVPAKNKEGKAQLEGDEIRSIDSNRNITHTVGKTGIMKAQVSDNQPSNCSAAGKTKDTYDISEVCPWELEDLPTPSENKIQKHVSIAPEDGTNSKPQQKVKVAEQSALISRHTTKKMMEIGPRDQDQVRKKKQISANSSSTCETARAQKAEVCPWEFEELPVKRVEAARSPDRDRHKTSTSPGGGKRDGNFSDQSTKLSARADVCPWEYDTLATANPERASSPTRLSKTKDSSPKKQATSSSKSQETEKGKPKDRNNDKTRSKDRENTEKRSSPPRLAEICPWDVDMRKEAAIAENRKSPTSTTRVDQTKQADICPWDFQEVSDGKGQNKLPSTAKQSSPNSKGKAFGNAAMAEVCPWDFEEPTTGKKA